MSGLNQKFYSILLYALMGISGLLFILFMGGAVSEGLMLNWCFVLFAVAAIVAIVFPIFGMVKDFKKAKNSLIGIGALAIIFAVGYSMSTEEAYAIGERVVEGTASKRSEAGLITFYIMIFLAIGAIVYTEISKAFK